MNKNDCLIRLERPEEYAEVENMVRDSFWNVYRPGCLEHWLMHIMRESPDFVPELDLVMECEGQLIGQNVFVRAKIDADDGREVPILTMGPICVRNDLKRQGFGKLLLVRSLELAKAWGAGALCFEGNIGFYGKSGFTYASEFGIRYHGLPEGADASFFLCRELIPGYLSGVTGVYSTPEVYLVSPEDAEKFDRQYPYKAKEVLPGQLKKR